MCNALSVPSHTTMCSHKLTNLVPDVWMDQVLLGDITVCSIHSRKTRLSITFGHINVKWQQNLYLPIPANRMALKRLILYIAEFERNMFRTHPLNAATHAY